MEEDREKLLLSSSDTNSIGEGPYNQGFIVCDEDLRWERVEIASRDEVNKEKEKESENTEGPSARVDHILIAAPAREGETTRAYLFGGFSSATRTTTNETWLITRRKGTPSSSVLS